MVTLAADQKFAISESNKLEKRIITMSGRDKLQYLDLRFFFFDAFLWTTTWIHAQLNTSTRVLTGKPVHGTVPPILTKEVQDGIGRVLAFQDLCTKTSFITLLMFQIEVFLKGLSAKLNIVPRNRCYSSVVNALADQIIHDNRKQKKKLLMTLAHVRNALHANGYHMNNDFEVTIDEITYKFHEKSEIDFLGWTQVFVFMNATLDVLEEIIFSSQISEIDYIEKESFLDLNTVR